MSRSAGTGSPTYFYCWKGRQTARFRRDGHRVELTGRTRPYHSKRYSMLGTRSMSTSYEYRCSCGHVGWSNHADLARIANDVEALKRKKGMRA